jgi:hypothetical protein
MSYNTAIVSKQSPPIRICVVRTGFQTNFPCHSITVFADSPSY